MLQNKMAADTAVVVSSYLNDDNKTDKHIYTLLKCIEENQCLQDHECSKEWTAKVNSFLNSKTDRWLGISLLAATLPQCDTDTFVANCMTWIKAILQVIQSSSSSSSLIQCSVKVMDDLLKYATQFPDISRKVASSIMASLIPALLSRKDKDMDSMISGICTCVRYMPGPIAPFRVQIENYIIPCLDSWNTKIRKNSCLCFSLLAGCSSSTSTSADKYKTNWEYQWNRLLVTINNALNNLYENVEVLENPLSDGFLTKIEAFPVNDVTNAEPERTNTLTVRLMALLDCLNYMTREGSHRISNMPVHETLMVIDRIVGVNGNMLKSVSVDVVLLKTCLPVIHESAVQLLCSLLQRCGSLLLPNSSQIVNVLIRGLSWTSNNKRHGHKAYSHLRCALFKCFIHWCHVKASISTDIIKKVIHNIFTDITPQANQTKLINPDNQKQPKSSKKAKKRKLQEMEQLSTSQKKENPMENLSVCHTALSALYAILMNGVANISKDVFQEIQGVLLNLILQCQVALHGRMPSPYSDADCRQSLYQCLLACVIARPPQAPSSIQCAIRCCTRGLQDMHPKVSSYCQEALTILTAIVHPLVPSLESATQFALLPINSTGTRVDHDKDKYKDSVQADERPVASYQNDPKVPVLNGSRLPVLEDMGSDMHPVDVSASMQAVVSTASTEVQQAQHDEEMTTSDFNTDNSHVEVIRNTLPKQHSTETQESVNIQAEYTKQSGVDSPVRNQSTCNELMKDFEENFERAASKTSRNDISAASLQKGSNGNVPMVGNTLDAENEMIPAKVRKLEAGEYVVKETDEKEPKGETSVGNANMAKDIGDVDEMLASFVNSSPDSDSD